MRRAPWVFLLLAGCSHGARSDGSDAQSGEHAHSTPGETRGTGGGDTGDSSEAVRDPLQVCADGSATYTRIQDAIDAGVDGDAIEVCAGTWQERPVVQGKALTLRGAGADVSVIKGAGSGS